MNFLVHLSSFLKLRTSSLLQNLAKEKARLRNQQVLIISQLSNTVSPKKWNLAGLSWTFRTEPRFQD
jgi:hypothetical protein